MSTLRQIVDSVGTLQLGVNTHTHKNKLRVEDDAIIHKRVSRSGPATTELIVGKILAMNDETAEIGISRYGTTKRVTVPIKDLSPVTKEFKRTSVQFNTNHLRRA